MQQTFIGGSNDGLGTVLGLREDPKNNLRPSPLGTYALVEKLEMQAGHWSMVCDCHSTGEVLQSQSCLCSLWQVLEKIMDF